MPTYASGTSLIRSVDTLKVALLENIELCLNSIMGRYTVLKSAGERTGLRPPSDAYSETDAEHLDDFIQGIPTLLGRLIQLGGCLDRDSGIYHPLNQHLKNTAGIGKAMAIAHERILLDWLSSSVAFQISDMAAFVRRNGGSGQIRLRLLLHGTGWSDLMPANLAGVYQQHLQRQIALIAPLAAQRLE